MMKKNIPGGGGPKTPVPMVTTLSSGVSTAGAEAHKSTPAEPGVALIRGAVVV